MKILLIVLVNQLFVGFGPYAEATCSKWTPWFDRDDPSANADAETLDAIRGENPGKVCASPTAIEVRNKATQKMVSPSDGVFKYFDTIDGFLCLNEDQCDHCDDYEVRFCCSADGCQQWTSWYDRDDPSASGDWETLGSLRSEHPGDICASPTALEVRLKSNKAPVERYGGKHFYKFDTRTGFACRNADQCDGGCPDYEVRYCCK